ncbi:MAG: PLDc N-terminal domain-containing protein, partial [Planctomycetes bacterium]|nr:PLDc N-terminal domain-containing protein [Planctomycetota bacterium]
MFWAAVSVALTLGGWLLVAFLVPRVVSERRESAATLAWVLAIVFMPFVGALLYWAFGVTRLRRKRVRRRRALQSLEPELAPLRDRLGALDPLKSPGTSPEDAGLMRAAASLTGAPATLGNRADLLLDGKATFAALAEAIEAARDHVHLEYYIFRPDGVGRSLLERLERKARAGVEVRLLVDGVGSWSLAEADLEPLRKAGGRTAAFAPVNPLLRRWSLNLRNHRKIVVVDGQVGFTGGVNV